MTVHRYHPASGEPKSMLYDDCDRCAMSAHDPRLLDSTNLKQAWTTAKSGDWSGNATERILYNELYKVHVLIERLNDA